MSPFEALYGIKLAWRPHQQTNVAAVEELVQERHHMDLLLNEYLVQARARMKFYVNQHRVERVFEVGDWVYLKLHHYRQHLVMARTNKKIVAKYFRPCQITRKIGQVVYELILRPTSRIQPIFYVSFLKKKMGKNEVPILLLLNGGEHEENHREPVAVLQTRIINRNN